MRGVHRILLSLVVVASATTSLVGPAAASMAISCPAADVIAVDIVQNGPSVAVTSNDDFRPPEFSIAPAATISEDDGTSPRPVKVIYKLPIRFMSPPEFVLLNGQLARPMAQLACTADGIRLSGGLVRYLVVRERAIPNNFRVELIVVPHQRFVTVKAYWPQRWQDLPSWGVHLPGEPRGLERDPIPGTGDPIGITIYTPSLSP
jgi:hypothetical protein